MCKINIILNCSVKTIVRAAVSAFGHQSAAYSHHTNPFWREARGSLLLRTRIMMMEKRKKKQAMAKHMRYTDLYPTMMSQFTLFCMPGMDEPPKQKPGIWKAHKRNTGRRTGKDKNWVNCFHILISEKNNT